MQEKKDSIDSSVVDMLQENYVPSELERKKVVMYYFLLGIIIALSKTEITKYEYFHLRQAMGRWTVFFLVLVVSIVLFFIPYFRIIPFLMLVVLFGIWIFYVKQAWEGKYVLTINGDEKVFLPFFQGIG